MSMAKKSNSAHQHFIICSCSLVTQPFDPRCPHSPPYTPNSLLFSLSLSLPLAHSSIQSTQDCFSPLLLLLIFLFQLFSFLLPSNFFLPPSPAHPSNSLAVTPLVAHHPLPLSARLVSLSPSNPLPTTVLSIDRALWLPPEVASPRLLPPVLPLPLRDRLGLHRQS